MPLWELKNSLKLLSKVVCVCAHIYTNVYKQIHEYTNVYTFTLCGWACGMHVIFSHHSLQFLFRNK